MISVKISIEQLIFNMGKQIKVHFNYIVCEICGKKFRFNLGLNNHLKNCRMGLIECKTCKNIIGKSAFEEHSQTHISGIDKKIDSLLNIKLSKSNGVWNSTLNCVYKCKICFEKFESLCNLTEHIMKIHEANESQIQSTDYSTHISADELENDNILQSHNKSQLKCLESNIRFDTKETLNLLLDHYSKKFQNTWNEFQANDQDNLQLACCCMGCGSFFTTKDSWSKHLDEFQKNKNCIKTDKNSIKTSTNIFHYSDIIFNDMNRNMHTENSTDKNLSEKNNPDQASELTEFKNSPYTENNNLNVIIGTEFNKKSVVQNVDQNSRDNYAIESAYYQYSTCNNMLNNQNLVVRSAERINMDTAGSIVQKNLAEDSSLNTLDVSRFNNNVTPKKCLNIFHKRQGDHLISYKKSHHLTTITHSSSDQVYKCENCNKTFNRKASYSAHIQTHNVVSKTLVKNVKNKKSGTLKTKQNKEHKKKQNYYSSKSISSSFIETSIIDSTKIDSINQPKQLYKCGNCKRKCKVKSLWKKHLSLNKECHRYYKNSDLKSKLMKTRNRCILSTSFKCYVCWKAFSSSSIRKDHIINVHVMANLNSDSNINVVEPKKKTETKRKNTTFLIKKKKDLISYSNSNQCQLCSKSYSSKSHLYRHVRNKHANSNSNTNINVVKQNKKMKTETKRKHTTFLNKKKKVLISNSNSNQCQLCSKSYSSKSHLYRHVRNNHANGNSNTDIIVVKQNKKLKTETKRKNTKFLNKKKKGLISNNNSNQCQLCSKSYSSKSHLYRHVRNNHAIGNNITSINVEQQKKKIEKKLQEKI